MPTSSRWLSPRQSYGRFVMGGIVLMIVRCRVCRGILWSVLIMANNINIDDLLRHQTYLARLETQAYRAHIAPSLAEALRDILPLLAEAGRVTTRGQPE